MHILESESKAILSVITPISRMAGKLENLTDWLYEIADLPVQAIIVHDVQDELTGPELDRLIAALGNSRISIIHKYCGSPGTARNVGFEYASANWVCFWDSDDRPRVPEFLEMIRIASENNNDYCVGSYMEVSPTTIKHQPLPTAPNFDPLQLLKNPGIWRMGFNRDFISRARFAESRMAEDQFFLCNLNLHTSKIYVSENTVYEYHTNFGNQLTKNKKALNDIPQVIKMLVDLIASVDSANQIFFIHNVISRVSLTGIKKAKFKTKIEIFKLLFQAKKIQRSKVAYLILKVLAIKVANLSSLSKHPTLRVRLYGGLGNQLFQLAAGLATAGSRKLTLEIDLKSSDGNLGQFDLPSGTDVKFLDTRNKRINPFSMLCNLNLRLSTQASPNFGKRTLKFLSSSSLIFFLSMRNRKFIKVIGPNGLGYSDIASPYKHLYLLGYMQSYVWSENIEVREKLGKMRLRRRNFHLDSIVGELKSKKVMGVHVRLGDYLANPQFGQLSEDYYRRAVQKGLDNYEVDSIWVFSNDLLKARAQLKFLEEIGLEINWVDDSQLSSAELILLIANCAGLVLANSSFGWWGARLSPNAVKFAVAPTPWFAEIESPRLLTPSTWVQVDSFYGNLES